MPILNNAQKSRAMFLHADPSAEVMWVGWGFSTQGIRLQI